MDKLAESNVHLQRYLAKRSEKMPVGPERDHWLRQLNEVAQQ